MKASLNDLINDVNSAKRKLARARAVKPALDAAITLLHRIVKPTKANGIYHSAYISAPYWDDEVPTLCYTATVPVTSLKHDKTLLRILSAALDAELVPGDSTDYASEDITERTFRFIAPGLKLNIEARVKGDSPTCRKIVVGEETVTRPKYAIQCD